MVGGQIGIEELRVEESASSVLKRRRKNPAEINNPRFVSDHFLFLIIRGLAPRVNPIKFKNGPRSYRPLLFPPVPAKIPLCSFALNIFVRAAINRHRKPPSILLLSRPSFFFSLSFFFSSYSRVNNISRARAFSFHFDEAISFKPSQIETFL